MAPTREAASEEEAEELKALDALSGYRSDGRSLPEGHPADGRPGRSADEQTRNVVRLVLAHRGKVPARMAPRA